MTKRRIGALGAVAGLGWLAVRWYRRATGPRWVNDVHGKLHPTRVRRVIPVRSIEDIRRALQTAQEMGCTVCIAGTRHSMGGQPFGTDAILLDMIPFRRVLDFDPVRGTVEAEAGITWPNLIHYLIRKQEGKTESWGIAQKQTGADHLTLGGAVSSNVHGRGLQMKPIIADIEALTVIAANGDLVRCSREENPDLFRLVVGGYGLFGVIASVTLRLSPRRKLERVVREIDIEDLDGAFEDHIRDGYLYGDFQYATDEGSDEYLRRGVFSCYRPVPMDTPIPRGQREVSVRNWRNLVYVAHTDKSRAFRLYADYYRSTSGQIYWSDTHQVGAYLKDYHKVLDSRMHTRAPATEVITEIYVPRARLTDFMSEARQDFREHGVNVIYGTIRLIERDDESFLSWAREPYACVIFNLHTDHTVEGIRHSADAFRRLNDMAIRRGGSFYLTYHRFATREQVLVCYPQFPEFLRQKRASDPEERLQSDWYRHMRALVTGEPVHGGVTEKQRTENSRPSATACIVAAGVAFIARSRRFGHLVPNGAGGLSERFVSACNPRLHVILRRADRSWCRGLVCAAEHVIVPGILLHYVLRKRLIEEEVRHALNEGFQRVVVLGAGFDTLAARLCGEYPSVTFLEVDQASTQSIKRAVLDGQVTGASNLRFLACDLSRPGDEGIKTLPADASDLNTIVVAEGLLMYLDPAFVESIFHAIAAGGRRRRIVFTFMQTRPEGRPGFRNGTALLAFWLRWKHEEFRWGLDPDELSRFLEPFGLCAVRVANYITLRQRYLLGREQRHVPLAEGESVVQAWRISDTLI